MTDISEQKFGPDRLKKAHRLMEWSNIIVIACAALGATAWFTSHLVLFYVLGSIALILTLLFMWGPVIVGIAGPGEGRIVNGILFIVIGILITHRFWAGLILGGCFFGLFSMLPPNLYYADKKETVIDGCRIGFYNWRPEFDLSWIRYCKRNNICLFEGKVL